MSFRVRRAWWSGNAILQFSSGDKWVDAECLPDLAKGFVIVSTDWMKHNDLLLAEMAGTLAILRARVKLYDHRAQIARKSRAKKKAPVLTEALPGSDLARLEHRVDAQGMGYVVKRNDDGSFSDAVTGRAIESAIHDTLPPVDEAGKPIYTPRGPYPRSPAKEHA